MHASSTNFFILFAIAGKRGDNLKNALGHLQSGLRRDQFLKSIQSDVKKAMYYAQKGGLSFRDPLTAVYHYRKHIAKFPSELKKFGNSFEVYVGPVKKRVFDQANLCKVSTFSVSEMKSCHHGFFYPPLISQLFLSSYLR